MCNIKCVIYNMYIYTVYKYIYQHIIIAFCSLIGLDPEPCQDLLGPRYLFPLASLSEADVNASNRRNPPLTENGHPN